MLSPSQLLTPAHVNAKTPTAAFRMSELKHLYEAGVVDESEFERIKARIISSVPPTRLLSALEES